MMMMMMMIDFQPKRREPDIASGLASAMNAIEKAYGRPFGEMKPVPMMRFAQGGDVDEYKDIPNIYNQDDGGIMNKISRINGKRL